MSNGKILWEKIFNTDLEEAILSELCIEKDFDDLGTSGENKEIVEALEDKDMSWIVDTYYRYEGKAIDSSDLRYILIDCLQIKNVDEMRDW